MIEPRDSKKISYNLRALVRGGSLMGVLVILVHCSAIDDSRPDDSTSHGDANALMSAPLSIWSDTDKPNVPADPDPAAVELGLKFRSDADGTIVGIRFFKGASNTGAHTGTLWSTAGAKLATATFASETASGWQHVTFATPVAIRANTTYVASYHTDQGHYSADAQAFASKGVDKGPLHALRSGTDGANAVYHYGNSGYPTESYQSTNYWVDVLFQPKSVADAGTAPDASPRDSGTKTDAGVNDSGSASDTSTPVPPPTGAVPCALNAGAESCWAAHTGVPGYTEAQILAGQSNLKHQTGDLSITTDGTVIDGVWLDGCIAVHANNVTIKRSLIRSQGGCQGGNSMAAPTALSSGNSAVNGQGVTGLVIQDTEVDGMNPTFDSGGIGGSDYSCVRCNVHGFHKNFWLARNASITDSYSHDLASPNPSCIHAETVNSDSADHVVLRHSFLKADGASGCVTGAFMNGGSWGPSSHVTIDSNYLEGTAGADAIGSCAATYISYTNNAFSSNNGYGGTLYIYGFNPTGTGNVWSGNIVPETGKNQ